MKTILLQAATAASNADEGRNEFLGFGFFAFIFLLIYGIFKYRHYKKEKKLKAVYELALTGGNKKTAVDAGRAYFGYMRRGKKLTTYDEQRINNDIHAMNVK